MHNMVHQYRFLFTSIAFLCMFAHSQEQIECVYNQHCYVKRVPTDARYSCGVNGVAVIADFVRTPCATNFYTCRDMCLSSSECRMFAFTFEEANNCKMYRENQLANRQIGEGGMQFFEPRCFIRKCFGEDDAIMPRHMPRSFAQLKQKRSTLPVADQQMDLRVTTLSQTSTQTSTPSCMTVNPQPPGPTNYMFQYGGSEYTFNVETARLSYPPAHQNLLDITESFSYSASLTACDAIYACAGAAMEGWGYRSFVLERRKPGGYWLCKLYVVFLNDTSYFDHMDHDVVEVFGYAVSYTPYDLDY